MSMIELPDEIWSYIKEFVFDWKQTHKLNMESTLTHMIPNIFGPIYERWTYFPPYPNTNDIIRVQYMIYGLTPRPNLELTSITWNPKGTGGWWCGYGWERNHGDCNSRMGNRI
jgi:hypothetical protein